MTERAAIFDMDGLLIDSEPLWRIGEIAVFAGVGLELDEAMCRQTMGMRIDEAVDYWYGRHPWQGKSRAQVGREIIEAVGTAVAESGEPMPGVREVLALFRDAGWRIGLASSSPPALIRAVVGRLDIEDYFAVLCSAADEEFGKPHPGVYLSAARALGVAPGACLAFEDSVAGVESARAAGMTVVAVPEAALRGDPRLHGAHAELASLRDFSPALLAELTGRRGACPPSER